jgi:antitoxin (DNA-binding transcriptional repressor) of toxin-antitoxin stability system
MATTVTVAEAAANLRGIIDGLAEGEEVTITDDDRVVARLVGERPVRRERPGPGLCKGMITIVADDDEHLRDFAEYMP